MDVGLLGGGDDLVLPHDPGVVAVGDVLGDGAVEEHWLLRHKTQLSPHPADVQGLDVSTVDVLRDTQRETDDKEVKIICIFPSTLLTLCQTLLSKRHECRDLPLCHP